jgi:alpha-ketoglutarate-dependent taurine dioxygenase
MKVTSIPEMGKYGIYIDGLKSKDITDDLWNEIGQLYLENLVCIIRDIDFTIEEYEKRIFQWGRPIDLNEIRLQEYYNTADWRKILKRKEVNGIPVKKEDKKWLIQMLNYCETHDTTRVSGMKDKKGRPIGMFAEGELLWHSNESACLNHTPGVSLLGGTGMTKSCTGFITTAEWYENQTESFRSELDQMIIRHRFTPGKINPGLREEQDYVMQKNMCPEDSYIPLVIKSPHGHKGLHYSVNTVHDIKDMSQEESQKVFDYINKTLFTENYIYDHWYKQDNDLLLFDNSITIHRRLGSTDNRIAYRIQHDYSKLVEDYNPYTMQPFKEEYNTNKMKIEKAKKEQDEIL